MLFWRQIRLFEFFSSARWFKTVALRPRVSDSRPVLAKTSAASQLLGSSARKCRRWSFTCVNEATNWAPFLMSSVFSTPFSMARLSVNCNPFYLPMGVVRAEPRNVKVTQENDNFLGSRPCPFFNCSNFLLSRLISVCRSLRPRVSAKLWAHVEAWLWPVPIHIPFGTQLDWVRMPAENRMKFKSLPIG